jgi:hypothetical protein
MVILLFLQMFTATAVPGLAFVMANLFGCLFEMRLYRHCEIVCSSGNAAPPIDGYEGLPITPKSEGETPAEPPR